MSNQLMPQREATLFYTQSNERKVLTTSSPTWGDLAAEVGDDFSKNKVVLQSNRMTLENTEAILPTENFTLFVFPKSSKAGIVLFNTVKI